jgi:hypothetical protein
VVQWSARTNSRQKGRGGYFTEHYELSTPTPEEDFYESVELGQLLVASGKLSVFRNVLQMTATQVRKCSVFASVRVDVWLLPGCVVDINYETFWWSQVIKLTKQVYHKPFDYSLSKVRVL